MSYSTDPVADAAAYYTAKDSYAERVTLAEQGAAANFIHACRKGDANALADFAPTVTDWNRSPRPMLSDETDRPQRTQTLAEVLEESLDYTSGPSKTELFQLLLNVAFSSDAVNAPTQARELLQRMADKWAAFNTDVD